MAPSLRAINMEVPYMHADSSDSSAAGSNKPVPGCNITITPAKPSNTAAHTRQPECSPRKGPASAVTKSGTVKYNATASARGSAGKAM